jgi:hypothetical protein
MKYFGGLVVLLYALVAFSGWEPFTREKRGMATLRGGTSGSSGARFWTGGYMGGK